MSLRKKLEQILAIIRHRAKRPRPTKPWLRIFVVLPRPGVPEGDTTDSKCRGLVFPEGEIAEPNVQRGYGRVCTVGVGLFFGGSEGGSLRLSLSSEQDLSRENPCSNSYLAPESRCSRKRTHYRRKEPSTGVPRKIHRRPTTVQQGYRQVSTVGFRYSSGAFRSDSGVFNKRRTKTIRGERPLV